MTPELVVVWNGTLDCQGHCPSLLGAMAQHSTLPTQGMTAAQIRNRAERRAHRRREVEYARAKADLAALGWQA